MLAKNKYLKLNVKQQIHKLAFEARNNEVLAEAGEPQDTAALEAYLGFIDGTDAGGKLKSAAERARRVLEDSRNAGSAKERTMVWNLCYHDLLEIIEESVHAV